MPETASGASAGPPVNTGGSSVAATVSGASATWPAKLNTGCGGAGWCRQFIGVNGDGGISGMPAADGDAQVSVICPAKMYNKKCPICEAHAVAKKEGDEEAARELAPRLQVVSWVVNMKDTSAGPMLWSMGFRMDSDFIKLTRDPESGALLQVDNPEEGFNVHFQRQGTTVKDTRYSGLIVARKPSAIEEAWLEYAVAHPVPSTLVKRDYDEIKALYEGAGSTTDDDDKPAEVKPKAEVADEKPKFQSKVRPKEPEPEPEQAAAEPEQSDTPEADKKPPASAAAAASGMSKADELRAKLAARKAAQAK